MPLVGPAFYQCIADQPERYSTGLQSGCSLQPALRPFTVGLHPGPDLSQVKNEAAPDFSLQALNRDELIQSADLKGTVSVLDFFGTWCRPCIAELPILEQVRTHFADRRDFELYLVGNDSGGDNPEKLRRFAEQRQLQLSLAYDEQGSLHRGLGFTGVPALVVIDRYGRIRFTHEGYNASENLEGTLVQVIQNLLEE